MFPKAHVRTGHISLRLRQTSRMGSTAICDYVKLKICIFNNWSVEKNANADVTYESTLRPKGYRTAELKTPEVCCCSKPYN